MAAIPRLLFLLVLIVVPVVVYATSASLPERVATHFGPGGVANGFMSHGGYLTFMLAMSTRNVAYQTLTTRVPGPTERAQFMSLQSALASCRAVLRRVSIAITSLP